MGEPAVRASQVREDIWQRSEAIGIDLNASRDRSASVWTLDEQNTHATLLSTSFLRTCNQDLAAGEIGSNVGEIKCRGDDGLDTVLVATTAITRKKVPSVSAGQAAAQIEAHYPSLTPSSWSGSTEACSIRLALAKLCLVGFDFPLLRE
jgi:hypothetical protein